MIRDIIDFLWMVCLLNFAVLLTSATLLILKIFFQDPKHEVYEGEPRRYSGVAYHEPQADDGKGSQGAGEEFPLCAAPLKEYPFHP